MQDELNSMLAFVEELSAVNVDGVEPMTSVIPMKLALRKDDVRDQAGSSVVTANAPESDDNFFVVPKVIE